MRSVMSDTVVANGQRPTAGPEGRVGEQCGWRGAADVVGSRTRLQDPASPTVHAMRCPTCRAEYEDDVTRCADCRVALVPDDQPLPPRVDGRLGAFHPVVAERITTLLDHRRIAHEALATHTAEDDEDGRIEILVDRELRDDLRAELAVNYQDLIGRLPQDEMYTVLAAGGVQPGWFDAPRGGWVDRHGRFQVEGSDDEEDERDARRALGPALATIGAVLALFGWYAGDSGGLVFLGLTLAAIGVFLPR